MAERLFSGSGDFIGAADNIREIRTAILAVDWGNTPAGPIGAWPVALRATVRTILYAASPMAVLIGREGIVVCNAAAREIFGDAWRDAQGRPVFESLPVARSFYREKIDDAYRGKSHRLKDQPIRLVRDGVTTTCWFNLGLSPIMDDSGVVLGTLLAASETTAHVRTRRELTLAQERVEVALEAGGIVGTWDFDVPSRMMVINGSLAAQHGISSVEASKGIAIEKLFETLHDDDRQRVLAAIDEAVQSGEKFHSRFRAFTEDGAMHWYVASGRPARDEAGNITSFAGILLDTTSQSEVTAALEASNLRFDTLAEAIPQIVWSTDAQGNHDFFNQRWTEFTGIDHADITPSLWTSLVHPEDWSRVNRLWSHCLSTGEPYDIDYRFRHHADGYRWLRVIALPIRDTEGNIIRWYGTSTDIDDAKRLEAEREIVNRELDHRIGNLFAVINGLIGISSRDAEDVTSFANELKNRLLALHKAHQLGKARAANNAVSLRNLFAEILAPYRQAEWDGLSSEAETFLLKAESVSPFALVLHELATNSAKYGALSRPDGRIELSVTELGEQLAIEWYEPGVTMGKREDSGGGFGSNLLSAIVEGQFGGCFERRQTSGGIRIDLHIPKTAFFAEQSDAPDRANPE
ncbi:PAS domain-containing protein [Paracoccus pantotrophus]|uniref:histidine kinase n=1 Tax=Paracoccus pantotrophus TaxID=82367 RepID=A0A7H9BZ97_PARPN|nr:MULTISPECIES: PAS domain-containing protein [Paracoccus]QLH16106.1 PAS domain-containing protein [Paracoccus pantotrophus]UFM65952.1 PAS domain-containing protein [Paracoccus sp. MA]